MRSTRQTADHIDLIIVDKLVLTGIFIFSVSKGNRLHTRFVG
jgi:hypothetical protein